MVYVMCVVNLVNNAASGDNKLLVGQYVRTCVRVYVLQSLSHYRHESNNVL